MRTVIDTFNNLVIVEKEFEYDLLITIMEEEGKGIWVVLNEMISGVSVSFPPFYEEGQQAFNEGGTRGAANHLINNLGRALERCNPLWNRRYVDMIIYDIKESDAFKFIRKYM